jgi:hypothetical protein
VNASATHEALKRVDERARELEAERRRLTAVLADEFDREFYPAMIAIKDRADWVLKSDTRTWEPICMLDALALAWVGILDPDKGKLPARVRSRAGRPMPHAAPIAGPACRARPSWTLAGVHVVRMGRVVRMIPRRC